MFALDIQPRFTDFDMFGHVNNTAILQYLDLAKSMFFNRITDRPFDPEAVSAAIVNINIDFMEPVRLSEPVTVHTAVERLGDRSFTLLQEVLNPDTGHRKAVAHTVMAGFDIATQSSAPLRPALRAALAAHLHA